MFLAQPPQDQRTLCYQTGLEARAIEIMRAELDTTMALIGDTRIGDINRDRIVNGPTRQPNEKVWRVT